MRKQKQPKLRVILSMVATLTILPLVFSTFFSGYKIINAGAQGNKVVEVSLFEYITKSDFLLSIAFVSCMLSFILIITVIVHSLVSILKDKKDNFLGITLSVVEIMLSIMAFVVMIIYCSKNTISTIDYTLKYSLGPSTIIYFVSGVVFGIISIIAYLVKPSKKKNKKLI